jgi:ferredoxin, 2Fe-2S
MSAEKIKVIFIEDGQEKEVEALVGLSILEVAHSNSIDLEGACEGSLACATCHVVLEDKVYNMLDQPEEAEEDMLDLAFGLTHTSRLGCQIILTKKLDGMRITLPSATRNINL